MSDLFPDAGGSALSRFRQYVNERMTGFAGDNSQSVVTHIEEGRPYEQIVRVAAEKDVDLIVIGTNVHPSLFGGTPVLGSETERVVRNAPCPVLSVPTARVVTPIPALVTEVLPQT
jgi:nucleotide-binding universal stress UspA family protein